MIFLLNEPAR